MNDFIYSKRAYVGADGEFMAKIGTNNIELTLHNLTWDEKDFIVS